jgi:uncharacterized protein YceH (UPF0502 family)
VASGVLYISSVNVSLTEIEARVLGALLEKEVTTPEYYPLSLNALINACNQKSNREPVTHLGEEEVRQALRRLGEQMLARSAGGDSRVSKFEHRLGEAYNFDRQETATLCELLLRGPQTPGELRSRAERMHPFEDLSEVQTTLQRLMRRDPPLVKLLPRQRGMKEARYGHLLCGDVFEAKEDLDPAGPSPTLSTNRRSGDSGTDTHVKQLAEQVSALREEVAALKQQFAEFRKQFD